MTTNYGQSFECFAGTAGTIQNVNAYNAQSEAGTSIVWLSGLFGSSGGIIDAIGFQFEYFDRILQYYIDDIICQPSRWQVQTDAFFTN